MTTYIDFFIFSGCVSIVVLLHVAIGHFTKFFDLKDEVYSFEKVLLYTFFVFVPFLNILFALFLILRLYYWLGNITFEWIKRKIVLYKNPEVASLELLELVIAVYKNTNHTVTRAMNDDVSKFSTSCSQGVPEHFFDTLLPFIKKNHSKVYVSSALKEYESSFAHILAVIKGCENAKLEHRVAILNQYKNTLKVFQDRIETMKDKDLAIEGKVDEISLTRILDELEKETHIHQSNLSKLNSSLEKNGF